ncbi:hypothetical protein ACFXKY_13345 [Streptomyces canus]|uniref:hypothetical protein n=1 Tax=Streptomyces TaxID=1883 RepID=UPI0027E2D9B5|nr:hypothetical protein [Streptomyces lincolnensis]
MWSADPERAAALATRLECGKSWVNTHAVPTPGGSKWSGLGGEGECPACCRSPTPRSCTPSGEGHRTKPRSVKAECACRLNQAASNTSHGKP